MTIFTLVVLYVIIMGSLRSLYEPISIYFHNPQGMSQDVELEDSYSVEDHNLVDHISGFTQVIYPSSLNFLSALVWECCQVIRPFVLFCF